MKNVLIALLLIAMLATPVSAQENRPAPEFATLVFSKTVGFRHTSIPDGIAAIVRLGVRHGFSVDATEDARVFSPELLQKYEVVIFLSTTGNVLDSRQEAALQSWLESGKGLVGIHAAADTEYDWEWYGHAMGGYFKSHPHIQEATIRVEDAGHPSTAHLSETWVRTDEWYDYKENPRSRGVHVLMTLDESSYEGGGMGDDHPIAWQQHVGDGRVWYTGGGHTEESFVEPEFVQHMLGGIMWAAGRAGGSVGDASR